MQLKIATSLATALALAASLLACSDKKESNPDAPVIKLTDAVQFDAMPDAFSCTAPLAACNDECFDLQTTNEHCGACGTACIGGKVCAAAACSCAPAFAPAAIPGTTQDLVMGQGAIQVGVSFFGDSNGNHLAGVVYNNVTTPLNTDIVLTEATINNPPSFILGYRFSLNDRSVEAVFAAATGTLKFTKACDKGAVGVLTGATFKGVKSFMPPFMIDPNGCSFQVASLPFSIGKPDMCPVPQSTAKATP